MSNNSDLKRQIDTELKPAAGELAKEHEALKVRFEKIVAELSEALRKPNPPLIKQHLEVLNGLMPTYAALLPRAKTLLARIEKLDAGDERSDEHKALVALTKSLGELQGKLDRNYLKLKWLQDKAHDALAAGKASGATIAQEWAEMESWMDAQSKAIKIRLEQIKTLHELALGSVTERDAAELAQLQRRNEERTGWTPTAADVNKKLIEFFAKGEPKLSEDLRDQATRDRVKFHKIGTEIADIHKKIDGFFAATKALKIKPIDAKRAASVLDIPPSHQAKLQKALDAGASMERALDALVKELKLKTSGSEMINKLRKAKLV